MCFISSKMVLFRNFCIILTRNGYTKLRSHHIFKNKYVLVLVLPSIAILGILALAWNSSLNENLSTNSNLCINQSINYFKEYKPARYLVNNGKCKIPHLEDILSIVADTTQNETKCTEKVPQLTYVMNGKLFVRKDAIDELGFDIESEISCCYRTVTRVEQTESTMDGNADKRIRLSNTCHGIENGTEPVGEFLYVECRNGTYPRSKLVYTNMHIASQLMRDRNIQNKKLYWDSVREKCMDCYQPPNVLLLGIDSTSRMDFHRFLPNSLRLLKDINAIELEGFGKVGENTLPNFVALMTSYSVNELGAVCNYSGSRPVDDCPFLWKQFSAKHYVTGYLEDTPFYNSLSYMKTGFLRQPTDIYLRPWALAAYQMDGPLAKHIGCIGYQRPDQIFLSYINDLVSNADILKVPYFITTWLTDLTHSGKGRVREMDDALRNFLKGLTESGYLDNTILVVLSDHGYRWGESRLTMSGWFEDKLPAIFVKVPDRLYSENPSWEENIESNRNQLTTPFDIHETLLHAANISRHRKGLQRGVSLLDSVIERTCGEAGIPDEYCPCCFPIPETNLSKVLNGIEVILDSFNKTMPSVCTPLKLNKILGAATLTPEEVTGNHQFIVSFETEPGKFQYEALLKIVGNKTRIKNVQRINGVTIWPSCLSNNQIWLTYICYCQEKIKKP